MTCAFFDVLEYERVVVGDIVRVMPQMVMMRRRYPTASYIIRRGISSEGEAWSRGEYRGGNGISGRGDGGGGGSNGWPSNSHETGGGGYGGGGGGDTSHTAMMILLDKIDPYDVRYKVVVLLVTMYILQ